MSESGGGKSGVNVGAVVVVVIVVGVIVAAIGINNQKQSPKNEAEKVLKESVEKVKDATKDGLGDAKSKDGGRWRRQLELKMLELGVGSDQLISAEHIAGAIGLPDHLQGQQLTGWHGSQGAEGRAQLIS